MAKLILATWGEYQVADDPGKKSPEYYCPDCRQNNMRLHLKAVGFNPNAPYRGFFSTGRILAIIVECPKCCNFYWYHVDIDDQTDPARYPDWPEELIDRSSENQPQ